MATFKISPDKSRFTNVFLDAAFGLDGNDDTAGADTLVVDTSAYLIATGVGGIGAFLDDTKAWTVTVNGSILSTQHAGVLLDFGVSSMSSITVGTDGQIGGINGIHAQNGVNLKNSGVIRGEDVAIKLDGPEAHTITNAKNAVITSEADSIVDVSGLSNDKVVNAGIILGDIDLDGGNDTFINTAVAGDTPIFVDLGAGHDALTNSGRIFAAILGEGNNKLTNSGEISELISVTAGAGDDIVANSGKISGQVALGGGKNTLTNSGKGSIGDKVTLGDQDDSVTNSATIEGDIVFGNGNNALNNSGTIGGDVVFGGGNDVVVNTGTIGSVAFGAGDDKYTGGANDERVQDSDGADTIKLGAGNDDYFGAGAAGSDGADIADGGTGADTYFGGSSAALAINLDTKDQSIAAFGFAVIAKNTATGNQVGTDKISGFEHVVGGDLGDQIYGNGLRNVFDGGDGADSLAGFAGNDELFGGGGADHLSGGLGADRLDGSVGADLFLYTDIKESGPTKATRDVIGDFQSGVDDIWLNPIDANTKNGSAINDAFTWIGTNVTFTGAAGELRAYWTANGQIIEGDVNGDKKADFSIELIDPSHAIVLVAGDFNL